MTSKMDEDVIYKLPAELWISVFQLIAPVYYEQDRSAKAHIRIHFRHAPLHRVRNSVPKVYKEKYAICKNVALTCSTFARFVTPVLYSHTFLRGDSAMMNFLQTIKTNPALSPYVKALVLLPDNSTSRIWRHYDTLVSMLPNLRVFHMTSKLPEKQLNYPPSIEVLDAFLRYDSVATTRAIQISLLRNLRILSLHSDNEFPKSFEATCLLFPSLSALDITSVNNPVLLSVLPTWRMPKLSVLCMSIPPYGYLLVDLLKAVSRTILLLQLSLRPPMEEASSPQLTLPRLKELTLVARSMDTSPCTAALRVFHSLPALQLLNVAQPHRSVGRMEHVNLHATLEMVHHMVEGMNSLPKALESIRVWESRQRDMGDLDSPIVAYGVIRGHEARFHRVGLRLMVMGPSGKYIPAMGALIEVARG